MNRNPKAGDLLRWSPVSRFGKNSNLWYFILDVGPSSVPDCIRLKYLNISENKVKYISVHENNIQHFEILSELDTAEE